MLTITVAINNKKKSEIEVFNVSSRYELEYGVGLQMYEFKYNDEQILLTHNFDHGHEVLAYKVLHQVYVRKMAAHDNLIVKEPKPDDSQKSSED